MLEITKEMINIYKTYKIDWMNYIIIDNDITFHHIIKEENGGKKEFSNGALLTSRAHEYLHSIERNDIDIYNRINNIFISINKQKHAPSYKQREKIDLLLLEYEIKNADKIIKKKHKLGKKRVSVATKIRKYSQLGKTYTLKK